KKRPSTSRPPCPYCLCQPIRPNSIRPKTSGPICAPTSSPTRSMKATTKSSPKPAKPGCSSLTTKSASPQSPPANGQRSLFRAVGMNTVRPECDRPESPYDDAEIRIGRGLKHPKGKGYAKFLAELGYDRNWAGMLAAMIVEEGRVRVATSQKKTEFAHALRRLANPRLDKEAFLANAKVVLDAMSGTHLTR